MDNFTPGPWYWSDEYETGQGHRTMSLLGHGGFGILSCDGLSNSPQHVNSNDAHLIAAAPTMCEALERILAAEEATQYGVDNDNREARYSELAKALANGREALKKARNES